MPLDHTQDRGADGDAGRRRVFVVEVPLTVDGHIGLIEYEPGAGPGEPTAEGPVQPVERANPKVVAADADTIVEQLIDRAGFQPDGQVIQFLAAPRDEATYEVFRAQAQRVADLAGGDVYIVRPVGATVAYDAGRQGFAALPADGGPAGWQRLRPSAAGGQEGQEQPPDHFEADEHGILVPGTELPGGAHTAFAGSGHLVTFESAPIGMDDRGVYETFADYGGGLPVVVVPVREGIPFGSVDAGSSAGRVAAAVRRLGLPTGPVRLLLRPQDQSDDEDGAPSARGGEWAGSFASALGARVYLAEGGEFSGDFRDFTARGWEGLGPDPEAGLGHARDPGTGLLVAEGMEAGSPGLPDEAEDGDGARRDELVTELVTVEDRVRGVVLPGLDGDVPLAGVPDERIPKGWFVIVARGSRRGVTGLLDQEGRRVAVPPGRMAQIIREAREADEVPRAVVFLVPGLGWRSSRSRLRALRAAGRQPAGGTRHGDGRGDGKAR